MNVNKMKKAELLRLVEAQQKKLEAQKHDMTVLKAKLAESIKDKDHKGYIKAVAFVSPAIRIGVSYSKGDEATKALFFVPYGPNIAAALPMKGIESVDHMRKMYKSAESPLDVVKTLIERKTNGQYVFSKEIRVFLWTKVRDLVHESTTRKRTVVHEVDSPIKFRFVPANNGGWFLNAV